MCSNDDAVTRGRLTRTSGETTQVILDTQGVRLSRVAVKGVLSAIARATRTSSTFCAGDRARVSAAKLGHSWSSRSSSAGDRLPLWSIALFLSTQPDTLPPTKTSARDQRGCFSGLLSTLMISIIPHVCTFRDSCRLWIPVSFSQ